MKYFETYTSNTCAGSGNQLYFKMEEQQVRTGRVFYKIFAGGEYQYSFLFSNIIDSTENPQIAKFGGHLNAEGCTVWANALYDQCRRFFV